MTRTLAALAAGLGLLMVALAAPSPALASTTAVTCAETGPGGEFTDAHCLTTGEGEFSHVKFAGSTEWVATNAETAEATTAAAPSVLKTVVAGVAVAIECAAVGGGGVLKNSESGGEMFVRGTGVIAYGGCVVTQPAEAGCLVEGEGFLTEMLVATTQGQGAAIKVEPAAGEELAAVVLGGCAIEALNNEFPVAGSLLLTPSGTTVTTTHTGTTAQGTLRFAGQKAGLEGSLTLRSEGGEGSTPLAVT